MKIVLLGIQGSGKGTQAQKMKEAYNVTHISTGDVFRYNIKNQTDLGIQAKTFIDKGELVPDEITINMLKAELEKIGGDNFILDGFPRTPAQASALDSVTTIDCALDFELSDEEAIKRISGRRTCLTCGKVYHMIYNPPPEGKCSCGGEVVQRDDDKEDAIKKRLELYHQNSDPLIAFFKEKGVLHTIDATPSIDDIFANVRKILDTLLN